MAAVRSPIPRPNVNSSGGDVQLSPSSGGRHVSPVLTAPRRGGVEVGPPSGRIPNNVEPLQRGKLRLGAVREPGGPSALAARDGAARLAGRQGNIKTNRRASKADPSGRFWKTKVLGPLGNVPCWVPRPAPPRTPLCPGNAEGALALETSKQ